MTGAFSCDCSSDFDLYTLVHFDAIIVLDVLSLKVTRMKNEDLLREKRNEILQIVARHGARNVRIFGSTSTGESQEESDIDLLVDTTEQTSPWFPVGLKEELEELLGKKVDILTEDGLYWLLRRRILNEAKRL